jgi:predicted metal-binding membrane protein
MIASRPRLSAVVALLVAAGLAWWSTAVRMAGMDAGPGTSVGELGWFVGVWTVMMAAMMLPSLAPTAGVYATLAARRDPSPWLLFTAGYLLVWVAAGAAAYALFAFGKAVFAGSLSWHTGGQWVAAGVLTLAALYQLTPAKSASLRRCRSRQQWLREPWGGGSAGALAKGVRNGVWCVGSSWALMASLFALGVMSLTWMGLIAALVALEKLTPWRRAATITAASVLIALAVGVAVGPGAVPGLVTPDSSGGSHAMKGI